MITIDLEFLKRISIARNYHLHHHFTLIFVKLVRPIRSTVPNVIS